MKVIYEPKGKAGEYSELAINLYSGCSHACIYCYCPAIMRTNMKEWSRNPHPRTGILSTLEKDAKKMKGETRQVLLSFMSDPYHFGGKRSQELTRQALLILEKYKFKNVTVLTKGGMDSVGDFDVLKRNHWSYGTTISFLSEKLREKWEPNAAPIEHRISALKLAREKGIKNWVSVEPVIDADETLAMIKELIPFVDFWKIGKMNHNKKIEEKIDWAEFLKDVKMVLKGQKYYLKKDLLKFAD